MQGTNFIGTKLFLNNEEMLTKQRLGDKFQASGVKASDSTVVYFDMQFARWMYNITPTLHILVLSYAVTTEPFKQLRIPTGLTCEKGTNCFQKTLIKTSEREFIDCVASFSEVDGKMVITIDIPTGSTYTSFNGRIVTPFY